MKVIKKGPKNAKFGKKLTCKGSGLGEGMGGCGAVLHVVPADISNNLSTGGDAYWFTCPCCHATSFANDVARQDVRLLQHLQVRSWT